LKDLSTRAPRWAITPPVWNEYPAALDDVPLITRTYSQETIEYLAAHEIRYGDRNSGAIAMTFDCELNPQMAMRLMDALKQNDVQATFFVQGRFAYRYPDVIRRMVAEGHELGSHSFFHPLFTDLAPISMTQEITYTEAAIAWAVGEYVPMRYFRFPYAGRNYATRRHVASLGYQSSFWDIDPRGWDPQKTSQDVVNHVKKLAHAGGTIIMHCNSVDDLHALPEVLQVIRDLGLKPGTVTDVLTPEDRDVPGYQLLPAP
jgi:peptidoglycan/xylan/chitin deacetylase (PgdA/CDA1 family)